MKFEDHLARLLEAASADLEPPLAQLRAASLHGGRRRVRRRRAGAAGLGLLLAAVATLGTTVLTAPTPNATAATSSRSGAAPVAGPSSSAPSPKATQTVSIDLAAYSVHTDTHGTLTVTLRMGIAMFDLYHVRQILADAGVHADFTDGYGLVRGDHPWCTAGALPSGIVAIENNGTDSVITFDPAAIPAGTTVRFILFSIPDETAPIPTSGTVRGTLFVGARVGLTRACIVTTPPPTG